MSVTFTESRSWTEGGLNGQRLVVREGDLVVSSSAITNGAIADADTAPGLFNLTKVLEVLPFTNSANDRFFTAIVSRVSATDGLVLSQMLNPGTGEDINTLPTGTYKITIKGE